MQNTVNSGHCAKNFTVVSYMGTIHRTGNNLPGNVVSIGNYLLLLINRLSIRVLVLEN
jgi:hypothetical protein